VPSVLGDRRRPDGHWDYLIDPDKKIGYIRITSFIQKTADELKAALDELKEKGMKALILDLRDNPGGLLSSAVEVSDLFIAKGKIVSTKGRNTPEKVYEAEEDGTFRGFPMAVLVNEGSASAAEIVSACLQDHGRAVVVGQRSFGKGSVQNILDLEDGNSVLKLTVATYWRPSGRNIHKFKDAKDSDDWGVTPNPGMEVKLTPEEHLAWIRNRIKRDKDLMTVTPRVKEGNGEKPKDEKPKDDEAKGEAKPFVDRQLERALVVMKDKLANPDEAKAAALNK
jgi:carboxyl-terminal processing protease